MDTISNYEHLRPSSSAFVDHPAKHSYCLQSEKQAIIYLESPNGQAGFDYDQTKAKLAGFMLSDGHYQGTYYFPADGQRETFTISTTIVIS